jgi:hypothetical protein
MIFTKEIETTICEAGFNPDVFGRRPEYAKICIQDMQHDIPIVIDSFGEQDELVFKFREAIKAIEEQLLERTEVQS